MKIDRLMEKYLMERFSTRVKSPFGGRTTEDKVKNIAEYAATLSSEWMNIRKNQFWDLSKYDQLFVIDRDIDKFIRQYIEDLEDMTQEKDIKKFIDKNKKDIVKSVRKAMMSIFG